MRYDCVVEALRLIAVSHELCDLAQPLRETSVTRLGLLKDAMVSSVEALVVLNDISFVSTAAVEEILGVLSDDGKLSKSLYEMFCGLFSLFAPSFGDVVEFVSKAGWESLGLLLEEYSPENSSEVDEIARVLRLLGFDDSDFSALLDRRIDSGKMENFGKSPYSLH
jgi:hypothetical protein